MTLVNRWTSRSVPPAPPRTKTKAEETVKPEEIPVTEEPGDEPESDEDDEDDEDDDQDADADEGDEDEGDDVAEDEGPPFHDFALAMRDGYDDRGPIDPCASFRRRGLGAGLGAVARFSDEMGLEPLERGKRVWVIRYVDRGRGRA